jgi:hypothetical protein
MITWLYHVTLLLWNNFISTKHITSRIRTANKKKTKRHSWWLLVVTHMTMKQPIGMLLEWAEQTGSLVCNV